jgi:hypothetical protein
VIWREISARPCARHVIDTLATPCHLYYMASYDEASISAGHYTAAHAVTCEAADALAAAATSEVTRLTALHASVRETAAASDASLASATAEVTRLTALHASARDAAAASDALAEEEAGRTSVMLAEREEALASATAEVTRVTALHASARDAAHASDAVMTGDARWGGG